MSMPTVLVEMFMGGSWVDVSTGTATAAYLDRAAAPLVINRGRDNEQSDITPGVCTFSLVNDDGRFTIGNTAGAYSPNFKLWIPVRVNLNGVREFYGYMSQAETTWDDDTGLHAHTAVTCTDLLGIMAMSPNVRSWAGALIGALSPTYWWELGDAAGSVDGAPSAGAVTMVGTFYPAVGTTHTLDELLTFGDTGPAAVESDTVASITKPDDTSEARLEATPLTVSTSYTLALIYTPVELEPNLTQVVMRWATTSSSYILVLWRDGTSLVFKDFGNAVTITIPNYFTLGEPRLIAVSVSPGSTTLLGSGQTIPFADSGTMSFFVGPSSGIYSQAAIIPGAMSEATYAALKAKLIGDGSGPVVDWLTRAASEAGYASTVTATYDRTMERPLLKGSNPAAVGAALASSAGAVFAATKAGDPKWYDFTYCPTRIDIASGEWERQSAWAPDQSLYYSEVQFDGVVAGTVAGAFPRKALDVQPLLPAAEQADYATYLVNAQDVITGPRLSQIGIDMATVATPATYQAIDIRSRIALAAAPTQIPAGGVMTVEGYTHNVSDIGWRLTLSTAPDPRFVLGDSLASVLGDTRYRLAPLLP